MILSGKPLPTRIKRGAGFSGVVRCNNEDTADARVRNNERTRSARILFFVFD
jgi:hypothetical protein